MKDLSFKDTPGQGVIFEKKRLHFWRDPKKQPFFRLPPQENVHFREKNDYISGEILKNCFFSRFAHAFKSFELLFLDGVLQALKTVSSPGGLKATSGGWPGGGFGWVAVGPPHCNGPRVAPNGWPWGHPQGRPHGGPRWVALGPTHGLPWGHPPPHRAAPRRAAPHRTAPQRPKPPAQQGKMVSLATSNGKNPQLGAGVWGEARVVQRRAAVSARLVRQAHCRHYHTWGWVGGQEPCTMPPQCPHLS